MKFGKIALIVGAAVLAVPLIGRLKKLMSANDNVFADVAFKSVRFNNLTAIMSFAVKIANYSGFSVTPKNIYSQLLYLDKNNIWKSISVSNSISSLDLKNNTVAPIDIEFNIGLATVTSIIMSGAKKFKVVNKFDISNVPMSYDTEISIASIIDPLKKWVGLGRVSDQNISLKNINGIYQI